MLEDFQAAERRIPCPNKILINFIDFIMQITYLFINY